MTTLAVGGRTYEHIAISDEMVIVDRDGFLSQVDQTPNMTVNWTGPNTCTFKLEADTYGLGSDDIMNNECVLNYADVMIYDSMIDLLVIFAAPGAVIRTATYNDRSVLLRKITYDGIGNGPHIEIL